MCVSLCYTQLLLLLLLLLSTAAAAAVKHRCCCCCSWLILLPCSAVWQTLQRQSPHMCINLSFPRCCLHYSRLSERLTNGTLSHALESPCKTLTLYVACGKLLCNVHVFKSLLSEHYPNHMYRYRISNNNIKAPKV